MLCFVVLNVATLSGQHLTNGGKAKQIYGLAIGFCIVVGGYAIGSVSGGSLNPAVPSDVRALVVSDNFLIFEKLCTFKLCFTIHNSAPGLSPSGMI